MTEPDITNKSLEMMADDSWTGIPMIKTLAREALRLKKINKEAFETAAKFAESVFPDNNAGTAKEVRDLIAKGIRNLKTSND